MKIKGIGEITPDYPIGAFDEYFKLTGDDILFEGKAIDTLSKRKVFVFVGLKYGSPEGLVKTIADVDKINSREFIRVLTECLKTFTEEFDIEEVPEGEDEPKKK